MGIQSPLRRVSEPGDYSHGKRAIALAFKHGMTLDPWQQRVLKAWLAMDERRCKFCHETAGLSVPRQNGKSALFEARALYGMVILGERILFTAHQMKTARTFFFRLLNLFQSSEELSALMMDYREANGMERIRLLNGASLEVVARTKNAGRGFTVDVVMFDEAQELSPESLESLGPTTAAAPLGNRQLIFAGTPPSEVMNGEVFTRLRSVCLAGEAHFTCWHEWSIPDGGDLDSVECWAQANPALGYRLDIEAMAADRAKYSDEGFARERGGMWSAAVTDAVFDVDSWNAVADTLSTVLDPISIGVDIAPDRGMASIAIAGCRADGAYHVEVIHNRKGTAWVLSELRLLVAKWSPVCVVVDGPAASLVPDLELLNVPVYRTTLQEYATGCAMLYDYTYSKSLRHLDQPLFNSAVDSVRYRPVGDLYVWGRRNALSDVTPVVAATLALWGFVSALPSIRKKKRRTGRAIVM